MIAQPRTALNSHYESSHAQSFEQLAGRIGECNTDLELGAAIEAVEGALAIGGLTTAMVEGLVATAIERGRIIQGNSRVVSFSVSAEELIATDFHCPCCGQIESWGGGNASTCNVCHPRVTMPVTRAAA